MQENNMEKSSTIYSKENYKVWCETLKIKEEHFKLYSSFIHPSFIEGYDLLAFSPNGIPSASELNDKLSSIGWSVELVDGYLSPQSYMSLISNHISPINTNQFRSINQIRHAPGPDLIHDIIGHLPMLFLDEYTSYLVNIAKTILQEEPTYLDIELHNAQKELSDIVYKPLVDPIAVLQIENEIDRIEKNILKTPSNYYFLIKLFLWTIEFGVIDSNGIPQIYGSGLMSSPLEFEAICKNNIQMHELSIEKLGKQFEFSKTQSFVYVAKDFSSLNSYVNEFKGKYN